MSSILPYQFFNHKIDVIDRFADNIAKTPGTTKKLLQFLNKNFKAYDAYNALTSYPEFYASAKGAIECIEVYGLFKDVVYWLNPFRNKNIDEKSFTDSLDRFLISVAPPKEKSCKEQINAMTQVSLTAQELLSFALKFEQELMTDFLLPESVQKQLREKCLSLLDPKGKTPYSQAEALVFLGELETMIANCAPRTEKMQKTAKQLVKEILEGKKEHYSRDEVLSTLQEKLKTSGYVFDDKKLSAEVVIKKTPRPVVQRMYIAVFTVLDIGNNTLTFQKWGVFDLSHLATKIGAQSPIFAFIINAGAEQVLGVVASAGLVLLLGESIWNFGSEGFLFFKETDPEKKKQALKKCMQHIFEIISAGSDLGVCLLPFIQVANPPLLILGAVAKGTALIVIFLK